MGLQPFCGAECDRIGRSGFAVQPLVETADFGNTATSPLAMLGRWTAHPLAALVGSFLATLHAHCAGGPGALLFPGCACAGVAVCVGLAWLQKSAQRTDCLA